MNIIDSSADNVLNGVFAVEELSKSLHTVERWERTVEDDSNAARTQCISINAESNFNVSN